GEARAQEIIRRAETLLRLYENKDVTREGWRDVSHLVQLLANEPGYAERSLALRLRVPDPRWRNAPVSPKFPFDAATARRYQEDYAKQVGLPLEFTNSLGMTFRLVPPGTFLMGSPENEPGHNSGGYDETLHPVTLTRPFYLS